MLAWILNRYQGHDVFGMAVKQNNFKAAQMLIEKIPDIDINRRSTQDRIFLLLMSSMWIYILLKSYNLYKLCIEI